MRPELQYTELIRVHDPIEADLLAAFLGDGDIDFVVLNRQSAGLMHALMPRAANPVLFRVSTEDMERAQSLLDEYRHLQKSPEGAGGLS
jgi:hypothetical protein